MFPTASQPPPLLRGINQLSDTCTKAEREADRGREIGKKDDGDEEAERDKGGTSQIGNISFQHVLSEHFICEKRRKGDDPHGSKGCLKLVMKPWPTH